jgi:hypothetical protein
MPQGVNFTVQDNGLGQAPPGAGGVLAVIGVSSTGTQYQPFVSQDPTQFVPNFGYGPGPELAAYIAANTGNPVIFVKAPTASAGTNAAVRPGSTNTSTSVLTLTGTPLDSYYGKVTVLVGGTIGTTGITIAVSLDAGRTTYQTSNLLTATTLALANTGLTLNFAAGTLVAGDTFQWQSQEPAWNDAGVTSAVQSLMTINTTFEDLMITGVSASGDIPSFDSAMTGLFNNKRFSRCLCAARDAVWGGTSTETEATWVNALQADFANTSSLRVGVTGGHYNFVSPISQTQFRRPLLWGAARRDAAVAIQVDLGRVSDGAISMVLPSLPDGFIYHNENVIAGLDAARLVSMWNIIGFPGLYIKNPNLMAPPGSDFNWLQRGHVIDAACVIAYQFFVLQLSSSVRVSSTTGTILPADANRLQNGCNVQLANGLTNAGAVTSATTVIDQTTNLLITPTLKVTIQVIPLAYLKTINVTMTFLNPALIQVGPGTQ